MTAISRGSRSLLSGLIVLAFLVGLCGLARAQLIYGVEPGPRSHAHQGVAQCEQCHVTQKIIAAEKCITCHTAIGKRLRANRSLHALAANQKIDCVRCHREHRGADFDISGWPAVGGASGFDHAVTGYALRGKHLAAAQRCISCHPQSPQHFDPRPTLCGDKSCHGSADAHKGSLGTKCGLCHSELQSFAQHFFEHNDPKVTTRFRLRGKHLNVSCQKCHRRPAGAKLPIFKPTPTECKGCHLKDDPHKGRHGTQCEKCHEPAGWT